MANFRQIHVKIWKDNWFLDLDPKEKLLYIYLFSNDLTSLAGIYQISPKVIAFETGLNRQWITKALSSFQAQGKIEYEDGYIWLKKLRKYHETSSHTVQIRIKNDLDNIPDIPLKALYISYYDPDIPYRYPIDTDLLKEEEEEEYEKEEEEEKEIEKEYVLFQSIWNAQFHEKQIIDRNKSVQKLFNLRAKDPMFLDGYEQAILNASASNFIQHEFSGFKASWFLSVTKNDPHWERCFRNEYKNSTNNRSTPEPSGIDPEMAELGKIKERAGY